MCITIRQALRSLANAPAFTALVVLMLALGIGANTAIFSVVDGVLLKPLPFRDADRLVAIDSTVRGEPDTTGYPDFLDWRAQATTLDRLAAYATAAATITGAGDATSVPIAVVTADFFPLVGVAPLQGRVFRDDDDRKGAARTAVISQGLWERQFARDPGLVGRAITLDGEPVMVVGIMPASFAFPIDAEDAIQIWMPVMASRFGEQFAEQRGASFLKVIGRLRARETSARSTADLGSIAAGLDAQYSRREPHGVTMRPLRDALVKDYRLGLIVLFGAVTAVLLIACANIANMLLARGSARRREMAIRTALGASRGRIIGQLLTESLTLSVLGGVGGLVLALWGVEGLVRLSPLQIPRLSAVHVDVGVLAFTVLATLLTGVLSGLAPAIQLSRADGGDSALRDGDRGTRGPGGTRLRQGLVVAEVALSLVLLVSAGLLTRSLAGLQRVHPGFTTQRAVTMQILLPQTRYAKGESIIGFYRRLRTDIGLIPGASSGAVATTLPLSGSDISLGFEVEGRPVDPATPTSATFFAVSPEYASTMGIPLLKGRFFSERDDERAPSVVVINEAMAAQFWPGENPVGRRLSVRYNKSDPREIVGVVGDVKQSALTETQTPQIYAPFPQAPFPFLTAVVRTSASPLVAAASLRAVLARLDPQQAPAEIKPMDEYIARAIATPRFTTVLVGLFAALALLLAAFGLYGVTAYSVSQRRREIGIRMALGAQPADVRSLVVRQAFGMGAVGLAVGLAAALTTTRLLGSLLFGVTATDPATFAGMCVVLLGVVLMAAYLPARRATRVDPIVVLRAD